MSLGLKLLPLASAAIGYERLHTPPHGPLSQNEEAFYQHLEHSIPQSVAGGECQGLQAALCVTQAKIHLWKIHNNIPLEKY